MFKAKGRKQKAQEVKEDRHVKEEVPIDKRRAEIVKVRCPSSISVFHAKENLHNLKSLADNTLCPFILSSPPG